MKTVIGKEQIARKVSELAMEISSDYGEDEVVLICNLKGAFIFLADLCRQISSPVAIDFIATSSYKGTTSTGDVRIIKDLKMDIRGKNILLVEDIIDTGYTVDYIIKYLKLHEPRSIKICALLDKAEARKVVIDIDYTGFVVPNTFLIGYGLDYNERHRELDYIAELAAERNHGEQQ
jgi:hypoxanthine phosphoribosyltransferase